MSKFVMRDLSPSEFRALGQLTKDTYPQPKGLPTPEQQPDGVLAEFSDYANRKSVRVLVACTDDGELLGGVAYFGEMTEYVPDCAVTNARGASGIRLLGVTPAACRRGIGKALTCACIQLARAAGQREVILHTTHPRKVASLYEGFAFERSKALDFTQGDQLVRGFRLQLH